MVNPSEVLRYTAFSESPVGGNRAGVVMDATALNAARMQAIAAQLGYSETAFITSVICTDAPIQIRYFAPEGEVPFCGHATIATAAALAEHYAPGTYRLATALGIVPIVGKLTDGIAYGSLESPATGFEPLADTELSGLLGALHWSPGDLDPQFAPGIGTAGNRHPVIVAASIARLADLNYDFDALQALCRSNEWITIQLVAKTGTNTWRSRNPFPYGGVIEDAATGSAAAAFSGYLRALGQLHTSDTFTIQQGVEMRRPSLIEVEALPDRARISGAAVPLVV